MVLTVSFVLSPVIGLVCHRRWQIIANLTPASRRQDHTTSPSAAAPFVCVSRAEDPIAPMLPRPPHPCPTFVTIAKRPSVGRDGVGSRSDLGLRRSRKFLQRGLDRLMGDLPVGQITGRAGNRVAGRIRAWTHKSSSIGAV